MPGGAAVVIVLAFGWACRIRPASKKDARTNVLGLFSNSLADGESRNTQVSENLQRRGNSTRESERDPRPGELADRVTLRVEGLHSEPYTDLALWPCTLTRS